MDARLPRRPLGATGLQVSPIGLAALSFGKKSGAARFGADDVERAYHEHGVNTFLVHYLMKDICRGVRRLIDAGHRQDLVLVSEVGLPFAGSVRRGLEKHLRMLGTDYLDVWLYGWVRRRWHVRPGVWRAFTGLREQGKARAVGFSCHDRKMAAALAVELPADVVMIRYNAAHRGAEREIFPGLAELGERRPGVIAYTATRWGMLLKPLPQHGFERGMTGGECYRFVLGNPLVDTVWCAPRTAAELEEDVAGALAGPLEPARHAEVVRFGDAGHAAARGGRKWMFGRGAG